MAFRFKQFAIDDHGCGMKLGTDSVLLGAWTLYDGFDRIIDLGAGSGVLALMAAQMQPNARITALEIDPAAVEAAKLNIDASPWSQRVAALCADALEFIPSEAPDLIISNPPYFTGELVSPDSRRAQARHANGRLGPLSVISLAADWLSPGGSLAIVTPADDEQQIIFTAEMRRLKLWRICRVRTTARKAPTRILWQFSRIERGLLQTELIIRNNGDFSDDYVALTRDFYLNL